MSDFCDECGKWVDMRDDIFGDPSSEARKINGRLICKECETMMEIQEMVAALIPTDEWSGK